VIHLSLVQLTPEDRPRNSEIPIKYDKLHFLRIIPKNVTDKLAFDSTIRLCSSFEQAIPADI